MFVPTPTQSHEHPRRQTAASRDVLATPHAARWPPGPSVCHPMIEAAGAVWWPHGLRRRHGPAELHAPACRPGQHGSAAVPRPNNPLCMCATVWPAWRAVTRHAPPCRQASAAVTVYGELNGAGRPNTVAPQEPSGANRASRHVGPIAARKSPRSPRHRTCHAKGTCGGRRTVGRAQDQ